MCHSHVSAALLLWPGRGRHAQRWSEANRENLGRTRRSSFNGNRPRKARHDLGSDPCCSRRARTNPVLATKCIWLLRASHRDLTARLRALNLLHDQGTTPSVSATEVFSVRRIARQGQYLKRHEVPDDCGVLRLNKTPTGRAASEHSPAPSTLIPLGCPASTPQIRVL